MNYQSAKIEQTVLLQIFLQDVVAISMQFAYVSLTQLYNKHHCTWNFAPKQGGITQEASTQHDGVFGFHNLVAVVLTFALHFAPS